jgi:hypothetical protein
VKWLHNEQILNIQDSSDHYVSETSENQLQHVLNINLIRDEDAGEYGVSVNNEYIPVTKLTIVQESEF